MKPHHYIAYGAPRGPLATFFAAKENGTVGAAKRVVTGTYKVQGGDSPKGIAARYGKASDWQSLVLANKHLGIKKYGTERGTGRPLYTFKKPIEGGKYQAGVKLAIPASWLDVHKGFVGASGAEGTDWTTTDVNTTDPGGVFGYCVTDSQCNPGATCVSGQCLLKANEVTPTSHVCGDGYRWVEGKGCVKDGQDQGNCRIVASDCTSGGQCCSGNCIAGKCQLFGQTEPPACAAGTHWDGQGCVANESPPKIETSCPSGQHYDSSGKCVLDAPPATTSSSVPWWAWALGAVTGLAVVGGVWSAASKDKKRTSKP